MMENIMFITMAFYPNDYGKFTVRAIRAKPVESLEVAINMLENSNLQGYIKKIGTHKPVWNNLTQLQFRAALVEAA